jgi:hypothetical protein
MTDSTADRSISLKEHEYLLKMVGGYTAFVAAILVATFTKSETYTRAWIVISLMALSLPSLVAYMLLDRIVRVGQSRKGSMYRGLALVLGFLPSVLGMVVLIGHFSVAAAVLFGLVVAFWAVIIFVVAIVGRRNPMSDI